VVFSSTAWSWGCKRGGRAGGQESVVGRRALSGGWARQAPGAAWRSLQPLQVTCQLPARMRKPSDASAILCTLPRPPGCRSRVAESGKSEWLIVSKQR